MQDQPSRRSTLQGFGLAAAGLTALSSTAAQAQNQAAGAPHDLAPPGGTAMHELIQRLARAPRRRDFRTVPMILDDPMLWDHEAMAELLTYRAGPKQIWDA